MVLGGERSASRPGRSLPPGKTRYPLYRRLGGPPGRSGQVQKISPPPGFDPQIVQPVASCYTDCATQPMYEGGLWINFTRTNIAIRAPYLWGLDSVFILEASWPDCDFFVALHSHSCGILPQNIQWCDTGKGGPQYWEENLSHRHSVHHKFYVDGPEIEPRSLWFQAGD